MGPKLAPKTLISYTNLRKLEDMKYEHLKKKIREVLNFPTPGIEFKDITPLLEDKLAFKEAIEGLAEPFKKSHIDKVVGIDARGFLFSSAVAYILGAGTVAVRKKGKLPYKKIIEFHDLEYGTSLLEMHTDSIKKGERVLIVDDVLATGGTAEAAYKLVKKRGGKVVGLAFLLEISSLDGKNKFKDAKVHSLLSY